MSSWAMGSGEAEGRAAPERLDALLRLWASLKPDALALADGPARADAGLGAPRRYSYAAAEAAVEAVAARLVESGLAPGDVVAAQLPHVSESVIAMLACLRADLVCVLASQSWRRREIEAAFADRPAEAAIGCWLESGRAQSHALTASGVRDGRRCFAFGLGEEVEGLEPLDAFLDGGARVRPGASAAHPHQGPALVSLSAMSGGRALRVPRSHGNLVAAGLYAALTLELEGDDVLLSSHPISGPTGLLGLAAPWLASGAALILHPPFDEHGFMRQLQTERATFAVLPPPALAALARDLGGVRAASLKRIGCALALPDAATPSSAPPSPPRLETPLFWLRAIGDFALVLSRDGAGFEPQALPLGRIKAEPRAEFLKAEAEAVTFLETRISGGALEPAALQSPLSGELALCGPLAPEAAAFEAWNAGAAGASLADGAFATGVACAVCDAGMTKIRCELGAGLARYGGAAVDLDELDRLYRGFPYFLDAAAFTIPDPVMGERIFAAVAPAPGFGVPEAEFRAYLEEQEAAPFKSPERLVQVKAIPRDAKGRVLRDLILAQV